MDILNYMKLNLNLIQFLLERATVPLDLIVIAIVPPMKLLPVISKVLLD